MSQFKDGKGVHFSDGGRKIIPQEGGSIAEGSASYCAFLYSWNYKETCNLGMVVLGGSRGKRIP